MDRIIEDKELGRLVLTVRPNAKRFIFRVKEGEIFMTIPWGCSEAEAREAIERIRGKLLEDLKKRPPLPIIDLDYKIDTKYFKLSLVTGDKQGYYTNSTLERTLIVCPPDADFKNPDIQKWLRTAISKILCRYAEHYLPDRIFDLSRLHNLLIYEVKINTSKGRWGSCSSRKKVNLSCYTLLLPDHLIDYVMLHELAHTVEMNHGERFWAVLDKLTDGKAVALSDELKGYGTGV